MFQGEVQDGFARVVLQQPVPESQGETGTGRGHRADHYSSIQLVQKPQAKGPSGRTERRVSSQYIIQYYTYIYIIKLI